ncbi:MAG: hypothetical protein AB1942_20015 [Pseudomonadota bacterium]
MDSRSHCACSAEIKPGVAYFCDEALGDGPWCGDCFAGTDCGRGKHGDCCSTAVHTGRPRREPASELTNDQITLIVEASLLAGFYADAALSEFEASSVREVAQRFCEQRRAAVVTDHEWPVIEDSVQAMRAYRARRMGEDGRALVVAAGNAKARLAAVAPQLAAFAKAFA